MSRARSAAAAAWLGFALAAIFFYPLAAALDSDPYYLQWQPAHSTEAYVALGLLTVIFGGLLAVTLPRSGRWSTLALGAIALIPLLSLGAGVSRQLPIDDALRAAWESGVIRYGVPAAVFAALLLAFVVAPAVVGRALRGTLFALSPIAIVVVIAIVRAASHPPVPIEIDRTPSPSGAQCPSVVALLFDELSYAYLYDGTEVRADYPEVRRFASTATNYLNVRAPGDETMVSVPGYLAGRAFDNIRVEGTRLDYEIGDERAAFDARAADGLFGTARAAGYSPQIVGYYFPYCDLLGTLVDACRSFSFYNISTVRTGFSPLHPIMTTLVLWPRQFPLGLMKNPPFARLQRAMVEETALWLARPVPASPPVFRMVHLSIPHLPFVFDRDGYDPPFDPLRQRPDTAYVRQVQYADRFLGDVLDRMRRDGSFDRSTIVVFSDHGFRSGGQETNSRHVPFLVKRAGQSSRIDSADAVAAEQLLKQLVSQCSPV